MTHLTQRFFTRFKNCLNDCPCYPKQIVSILEQEFASVREWHVAGIGSGTGFLMAIFQQIPAEQPDDCQI